MQCCLLGGIKDKYEGITGPWKLLTQLDMNQHRVSAPRNGVGTPEGKSWIRPCFFQLEVKVFRGLGWYLIWTTLIVDPLQGQIQDFPLGTPMSDTGTFWQKRMSKQKTWVPLGRGTGDGAGRAAGASGTRNPLPFDFFIYGPKVIFLYFYN